MKTLVMLRAGYFRCNGFFRFLRAEEVSDARGHSEYVWMIDLIHRLFPLRSQELGLFAGAAFCYRQQVASVFG